MMKVAKVPCGSCPYRRDVPSGIWEKHEYDKLPAYDGETWEQSQNLFLCHQRDGCLCAGWLACHGPDEMLALRLHAREVDPSVFTYKTSVPVFASGAEAREHGIREIDRPSEKSKRVMLSLLTRLFLENSDA